MVRVNKRGYLESRGKKAHFVVKCLPTGHGGERAAIHLGSVYLPKHLMGKRVQFKLEILKEPDLRHFPERHKCATIIAMKENKTYRKELGEMIGILNGESHCFACGVTDGKKINKIRKSKLVHI